ncbi:MAG: LicD family protein [Bacteroidales bacterium]|nr:LicD family protein [Bacteroidales bacterium]
MAQRTLNPMQVKQIQLELLSDIDSFCARKELRYSLAYGTLIGAVRHKGYIPWDDDIDLMMPRPDYDRFLETFHSEKNEVLDLSKSNVCVETFAKVCRKGTIMVDRELGRALWGVNVDIFPIDGAPDPGLEEHYTMMCRQREWISRLCPFYQVVGNNKLHWFLKYCMKRVRYPHPGRCADIKSAINADLRACRFEDAPLAGAYFGDDEIREFMPREWFESYIELEFEGKQYPVIAHYDEYLRRLFGDYMQLPPEDQRVSRHLYDVFSID